MSPSLAFFSCRVPSPHSSTVIKNNEKCIALGHLTKQQLILPSQSKATVLSHSKWQNFEVMWGTWSYYMEITRLFHFESNLNVSITHWNCFQNENVCSPVNKEDYSFAQPNHWQSLKNGTTLETSQRFMYSLGIAKMLTAWKGRTHKVWTPQGSVIVPCNMKHNILVMHKGCNELSSRVVFCLFCSSFWCCFVFLCCLFFNFSCASAKAYIYVSVLEEGGRKEKEKENRVKRQQKYLYPHVCIHAVFQGLILVAIKLTALLVWSK